MVISSAPSKARLGKEENPLTRMGGYVRETQEATERAFNAQSWNNLKIRLSS